jgi:hypothetical protein
LNPLSSRSSRQFYLFQTLVWFGYGFEQFLAGIGVGRSLDYYQICLLDVIFGILFTLIIRAVVEATWDRPLRVRLWAGGTVLVLMSASYGYVWKLVLYAMCEDCKPPPSYLGYISYFFGALLQHAERDLDARARRPPRSGERHGRRALGVPALFARQ